MIVQHVRDEGLLASITWIPLPPRREHQVSFELAQDVFADPLALSAMERVEKGKQRWQTVGMVGGAVILLVAHTVSEHEGEEVIRIISARKATKHERKAYEEG